ncbi:MAG: ATP-binding cassette domain-containing protein [Planctomycetes bacterium]|jgi:ATP-binding cassette subfamily F protein 3|nr:ATP-binding cassette domain-containing protein [Planctomycetota bacterium]
MSILLQVSNLSKQYSGQKVFSGLSFTISSRQKIGVIGRNGAGKSTLFRILTEEEEADEGRIIIGESTHIGYLKQEEDFIGQEKSLDYLKRLSGKEDWSIRKVADKFQLKEEKLSLPANKLSGGWRMRLRLVGMLLKEPNLFLLDEPTNYLDLNTLLLLENYLQSYKGSFLIISHDREFLKQTCTETLEVSNNGCYHYPGNIESYLIFKKQKLNTLLKANDNLDRQQKHLQDFVDRFRYKASKAKQAQSLIRKISKLENKRITIESKAGITRIIIPPTIKRQNFALRTNNLVIGYNEQALVSGIDFDCQTGEKLAILGLNGQGKTTLLRTLVGSLPKIDGSFRWLTDCKIAYHGQESIKALNNNEQVGTYLRREAASDIKTEAVLKMAGDFLFKDEELKKSIGVLSGGEKSRLVLAGLLLSKPDVFVLDEPTCHLDFETVEALGAALKKFNGSVLFASHDRTFTNMLATGLVEIKEGRARIYAEDYEKYVNELEKKLLAEIEDKKEVIENNEAKEKYLIKKINRKTSLSLEKELNKLKQEQQKLTDYFFHNPTDYDLEKVKKLEEIKKNIEQKEEEWLVINTK